MEKPSETEWPRRNGWCWKLRGELAEAVGEMVELFAEAGEFFLEVSDFGTEGGDFFGLGGRGGGCLGWGRRWCGSWRGRVCGFVVVGVGFLSAGGLALVFCAEFF